MAARQRKAAVGDDVSDESGSVVQETIADVVPIDRMTVTESGDTLEITYSRSWELAVVQYEKMSIFTSIKQIVPADSDLASVGEQISDKLNEIQGADLTWARSMTSNKGSLVTRVIP